MDNKEYTHCLRCGKLLKTDKAKKLGYGDICYKKIVVHSRPVGLFSIKTEKTNL